MLLIETRGRSLRCRVCPSPSLQVLAWYWPPVLFVGLIGIGVGLYHHYGELAGAPCVTCGDYSIPFTLTSFALSLLLVFRTNSSYDRRAPLSGQPNFICM